MSVGSVQSRCLAIVDSARQRAAAIEGMAPRDCCAIVLLVLSFAHPNQPTNQPTNQRHSRENGSPTTISTANVTTRRVRCRFECRRECSSPAQAATAADVRARGIGCCELRRLQPHGCVVRRPSAQRAKVSDLVGCWPPLVGG